MWPACCCVPEQCAELRLRPCRPTNLNETGGQWGIYEDCVQICTGSPFTGCDVAIKNQESANLINELVDFSDDEGSYIQGTGTGDEFEPIGDSRIWYAMECYLCYGDDDWISQFLSTVDEVQLRVRMRTMEESDDFSAPDGSVSFDMPGSVTAPVTIAVTNQGSASCTSDAWDTYEHSFTPTSTVPSSWIERDLKIDVHTVSFTHVLWIQMSAIELKLIGTPA